MNRRAIQRSARVAMWPFTEHDWCGFCGAEEFPDGSQPLIGEFGVVGEDGAHLDATAVLDARGLDVTVLLDNPGDSDLIVLFAGSDAARAVVALRDGMSVVELVNMCGAEVVS